MENAIQEFISYLHTKETISKNTEVSYARDLKKLAGFMEEQGMGSLVQVTSTNLNSYMLYMEREKFAPSSISRSVASIRAFYRYLFQHSKIAGNPSEGLKAPKIEKKAPDILSEEEMEHLLKQPNEGTTKGLRDRAMLELIYATGIRVTELIQLKVSEVNLRTDNIVCQSSEKERFIPFGSMAKKALYDYLENGREKLVGGMDTQTFFVNCSGRPMSRQGFWKVLKGYAKNAGIRQEITPHTMRHSFAAHMVQHGADLKSVQEMLGHSDISTTQVYLNMSMNKMRDVYIKAHPRK